MQNTEPSAGQPYDIGAEPPVHPSGRQPFEEPKLTFVEPKLVNYGNFEDVTGFLTDFGGPVPPDGIED